MRRALIGYTGFVGGNIASQEHFDDKYNSHNIDDIIGKEYDIVVSAANRAEMWRINQNPEEDLKEIDQFIDRIKKVAIGKLVLISTVGVYTNPNGANEDTEIEIDGLSPYGSNRYYLERFCRENFDTTILRLPGLFGEGLKKNVIYDLLHNNDVDKIHKDSVYQYYNLERISNDIKTAVDNKLKLVNLATPPVSTAEVARHAFNIEFTNSPDIEKIPFWDMRTNYGRIFGGDDDYICTKQQELDDVKRFVISERQKINPGDQS